MSGFICILNKDHAPADPQLLRRMSEAMTYRGPDDQRVWIDGNIGMAHALLRTTRESEKERQPLDLDGRLLMTGDIRLDRREELAAKLQQTPTEVTDASLVLRAYAKWRDGCVEHLAGDFAFAIWDKTKQQLFCARDHFGVCPLYYAEVNNSLIVGNDIRAMQLHPDVSDRLNERTIGDHLLFAMNMDPATTIYADIGTLPPARTLRGSDKGVAVRAYWDGPEERTYVRNTEDYVEQFRTSFTRAVADRLRTDRAGSHLSGGMDASSIAATIHGLMREGSGPFELRTYTIVYRELCEEEEGRYARMIAEQAGLSCEALVAEDYIMRAPAEHPGFVAPEPFVIPEMTAEFDIVRRVAGFARTLFAGFGGDPAFDFNGSIWGRLLRQGRGMDLTRDLLAYQKTFRRLPPLGLRTAYRNWRLRTRDFADVPDWIDPGFAARIGLRERQREVFSTRYATGRQGMAMAPLWHNIFAAADPGASGIPVKLRFPFFDLALVELLCTVPAGGWFPNKRLLRESMRGTLPDAVLQRPKTPLGIPPQFNKLARNAHSEWQADLATTPGLAAYVDGQRLMARLRADTSPIELSKTMKIWSLAYWLKHRASSDLARTV